MKIVAITTSTPASSVALADGLTVVAHISRYYLLGVLPGVR